MNLHRHLPDETPLDDCSGLKLKNVKNRKQLNQVEFANNLRVAARYLERKPTIRMAPFTREWMLHLHREMFGDVWEWAGKIRKTDGLNVGIPSYQIPAALEDLARDLEYWRGGNWPPIEQAATLHHRAVYIHPFLNGNGRWSRMLANIWLKQHESPTIVWPEAELGECDNPIRQRYIAAVKDADNGKMELLIELHKQYSGIRDSVANKQA